MPARQTLIAAFALLSACGFQPLYGTRDDGARVSDELAAVQVALIADRSGQILRNYLLDGLTPNGPPTQPRYLLSVQLEEPSRELTLRRDDTPTRIGYAVIARYQLRDGAGRLLLNSAASLDSDYEITNSEFATLSSRLDARDRLLQQMSEDIRLGLAAYFRERRG